MADDEVVNVVAEQQEIQDAPIQQEALEPEVQATEEVKAEPEEKVVPKTNKRIRELLSERDHWKQEAEKAKAEMVRKAAPTLEEFDHDIEKYTEAAVDHRAQAIAATSATKQATEAGKRAADEIKTAFAEMTAEAAKAYPDFEQVVYDVKVPLTREMAEALVVSDAPGEVAYYLGKHRDEAARIAAMPTHLQGYEIAKLEAKAKPSAIATNAPPPPSQRVSGTVASGAKSYDQMSDAEFAATRAKERAAWRAQNY